MKKALFLVVTLLVGGAAAYILMPILASDSERRPIVANVELVNNCPVPSRYFVVKNMETGRYFRFSGDPPVMKAKMTQGDPLKLVLDPKYDDVAFDGKNFKATPFQRVTADCSFGKRQRSVADGLRGSFGN